MRTILEKHIWLKRIWLVVVAYLCTLMFAKLLSFQGNATVMWGGNYFGYNIWSIVMFAVTIWLNNRLIERRDRRQSVFSCVGGILLAWAVVYGGYAHFQNDIYSSAREVFLQFGMIICLSFLTTPLISELFCLVDRAREWYAGELTREEEPLIKHGVFIKLSENSKKCPGLYFGLCWLGIFVCWLPMFLGAWPGNFVFDARYQLQNVIEGYYSTHHPLIHTLMMGKAYQLGQRVGDVSWGYQFYTLAQMLILSSAFAYFQLYLFKKHAPRGVRVASLLWFALFPMHPLFGISATKDVLCAAFFLYFMVFLVRLVWDREKFHWYSYAGMIVSGTLLSLFRNNALYAVVATGLVLVIFVKGRKQKGCLVGLFVCILLLAKLVNAGLIHYTNATTNDSFRESMSVPLQCLARVAAYRGEELSPELYEEICDYIPKEDITAYNPYLSDPVKGKANEELLKSNTLNFLKLWIKVGLQFPDEYMESFVTNTMGYWYPLNQGVFVSADISLYHTFIGMGEEIEKRSYCDWAEALYNKLFWTNDYHYVPILGYLFRNAPYIWLVLLCSLWSLYGKHRRSLLISVLPLLYIATCLLGPMAALRYIYSIVVCAPMFIYLVLAQEDNIAVRTRT